MQKKYSKILYYIRNTSVLIRANFPFANYRWRQFALQFGDYYTKRKYFQTGPTRLWLFHNWSHQILWLCNKHVHGNYKILKRERKFTLGRVLISLLETSVPFSRFIFAHRKVAELIEFIIFSNIKIICLPFLFRYPNLFRM